MAATVVKPKRKCCKSNPRCKRCQVTLKRLSKGGYATRREDGRYVLEVHVPKQARKLARKR